MNHSVREPFFITRLLNLILGIVILILFVMVLIKDSGTEIYEVLMFALAAVENFIGATVCFSEGKRVRGNLYAVICGIFMIVAIIMAVVYFIFV